jgi:hypothetical protein
MRAHKAKIKLRNEANLADRAVTLFFSDCIACSAERNSLFAPIHSLFRLLGNYRLRARHPAVNSPPISRRRAEISKFPVFFPVGRERAQSRPWQSFLPALNRALTGVPAHLSARLCASFEKHEKEPIPFGIPRDS